jgi:hypothetical protein
MHQQSAHKRTILAHKSEKASSSLSLVHGVFCNVRFWDGQHQEIGGKNAMADSGTDTTRQGHGTKVSATIGCSEARLSGEPAGGFSR